MGCRTLTIPEICRPARARALRLECGSGGPGCAAMWRAGWSGCRYEWPHVTLYRWPW